MKKRNILKTEYALQKKDQFCWLQPINALQKGGKTLSKNTNRKY